MPSENVGNLARQHAQTILLLPEPPETFEFSDVPLSRSELRLFSLNNLIEKDETKTRYNSDTHRWRVREKPYQHAKAHLDERQTFPCCGSTGVTNDDGTLRCIDCGARITREAYREVMN